MIRYNFAAGPAMLAPSVKQALASMVIDWQGTGLSITEIPHRSSAFVTFLESLKKKVRSLLAVDERYEVLFLMGGARTLFALIAEQFLHQKATYAVTGHWSEMAAQSALRYGHVHIVDTKGRASPDLTIGSSSDYLFICSNETIAGVQYDRWPRIGVPLIVDASSDIFSRRIDMTDVALLMAGAQKNAGIAGLSIVVVRKDWLEKAKSVEPLLSFREHANAGSLLVTPPALALGALDATIDWIEQEGGVEHFEGLNAQKASLLYRCIDDSCGFYRNTVAPDSRSKMNVVFSLCDEALTDRFLQGAEARGLLNLRGHRTAGAVRASIYNAMPLEGVQALCDWMVAFQTEHGQ